jgi:hypothetical protein
MCLPVGDILLLNMPKEFLGFETFSLFVTNKLAKIPETERSKIFLSGY